MKKLFVASLLVFSLLISLFEVPALATASKLNSDQKTQTVSRANKETKAKAKEKSKTKIKKKSKAKTKKSSEKKSKKKTNATSKIKSKAKTKITSKTKAKAVTKRTTTSRGNSGNFDVSRILALGMDLRGTPYRYSGMSPKGFDCSGFTSYVFKNAVGISLPHSSAGQANIGTHIDKEDLEPGDLVYFNTNGSGVSHVGIYVGGGNFIHASRTKGITVTNLNDSYYRPKYMGATRVR